MAALPILSLLLRRLLFFSNSEEMLNLRAHMRSWDMREGLAAFNEKRKPDFQGALTAPPSASRIAASVSEPIQAIRSRSAARQKTSNASRSFAGSRR